MKVLFVTQHYLSGNGGGVYASRAYINSFFELYGNLTLMFPMKDNMAPQGIHKGINLIPVYDNRGKLKKAVMFFFGYIHRYYGVFEKHLIKHQYDLVVFDSSDPSFRLIDIAKRYGLKVITIHHNIEQEYSRDNTTYPQKPFSIYWATVCEKEAILKSDLNLTITNSDRKAFIHYYDRNRIKAIEYLGCYESYSRCITKINHATDNSFIITGSLSAKQTKDSLIPWIHDYYPILKEVYTDARLILAGKNPSKKLLEVAKNSKIQIIESPQHMQNCLQQANYYICPINKGGGLKLRLMDGFKNGMVVITHEVSARGYEPFSKGNRMFIYKNKASFKRALISIKSIKDSSNSTIAIYKKWFSFESGVNRLETILKRNKLL